MIPLSPQQLIQCDTANKGCDHGHLDRAWNYLKDEGTVSYECLPFTSSNGVAGSCKTVCVEWYNNDQTRYKSKSYNTFADIQSIKMEINNNGPVQT